MTTKHKVMYFKEIVYLILPPKINIERTIIVNVAFGSTSQIMTVNEIIMFQVDTFRLRRLRQVASGLLRPSGNLHNKTP